MAAGGDTDGDPETDPNQAGTDFKQRGQPPGRPGNVVPTKNKRRQGDIFQAAVQLTRMAMALSDPNQPDNPLIFVNPAFIEQTGYEESEAVGRNCRFLQGPATDPATIRRIQQAVREQKPISVEIYNYRRDGRGFWNALYICPILDTEGRLVHYFASQVDVSKLKAASVQHRQAIDAVGSMASGVAHTVNNLMTVVLASIDQAARSAACETLRTQVGRAEVSARSAGRLTQQMLTFAQRQFLEERPADLNVLVTGLDDLVRQMVGAGIAIAFDLAADGAPALLDPGQFELALLALVQNAADATPPGGTVRIATSRFTGWDMDAGRTGRNWVELAVTDHGAGMTPEVARRATEPFFTTKPHGVGIGLSMVQGFVEQSAGRISIETAPGRGTTVRLAFPEHRSAGAGR